MGIYEKRFWDWEMKTFQIVLFFFFQSLQMLTRALELNKWLQLCKYSEFMRPLWTSLFSRLLLSYILKLLTGCFLVHTELLGRCPFKFWRKQTNNAKTPLFTDTFLGMMIVLSGVKVLKNNNPNDLEFWILKLLITIDSIF